jgi:hypothetical protein
MAGMSFPSGADEFVLTNVTSFITFYLRVNISRRISAVLLFQGTVHAGEKP